MEPFEIMMSESQERMLAVVAGRARSRSHADFREMGHQRRRSGPRHRRRHFADSRRRKSRRRDDRDQFGRCAACIICPSAGTGIPRAKARNSISATIRSARRLRASTRKAAGVAQYRVEGVGLFAIRSQRAGQYGGCARARRCGGVARARIEKRQRHRGQGRLQFALLLPRSV